MIAWLLLAGAALVPGLDYYLTSAAERVAHSSHDMFAAGGLIGRWFAVVGTGLTVVGVAAYSARKRKFWLKRLGTIRSWLYLHIFLVTLGPFLILLHTGFYFSGWTSIVSWSLVIVMISGVYGRSMYHWIPKKPHGRFLKSDELDEERDRLKEELVFVANSSVAQADVWLGPRLVRENTKPEQAIDLSMRHLLSRRRRQARLTEALKEAGVKSQRNSDAVRLILRENRLQTQTVVLQAFHELFHRWHKVHLRLVAGMTALVVLHIALVTLLP
ncbi:MAG: hypothetical protein ACR2QM_12020 [Longimicrobiales bacterium]